jgi:hypothetical protein
MSTPKLVEEKYLQHAGGLGKKISCKFDIKSKGWFLVCEHGIVIQASGAKEAFEVHGDIFRRYQRLGFDRLGFPLTDELPAADNWGKYSKFEKGYIFWSPATGAWEVKGAIYGRWNGFDGVKSFLEKQNIASKWYIPRIQYVATRNTSSVSYHYAFCNCLYTLL